MVDSPKSGGLMAKYECRTRPMIIFWIETHFMFRNDRSIRTVKCICRECIIKDVVYGLFIANVNLADRIGNICNPSEQVVKWHLTVLLLASILVV